MALTPKDNESFYREVDEELRRDQMTGFFRRYGAWMIAAVLLFLIGVAAYLWWQHRREAQAEQQAIQLTAVLEDIGAGKARNPDPRIPAIAESGTPAYRAAATLLQGSLAAEAGKTKEAAAVFAKVAGDDDAPQVYRDAALVRQTALEFDALQPAEVVKRLKPLAVQGNPWFGSAGELLAMAYMRQGKAEMAGPIFAAMHKDETLPPTIKERAGEMASALGADVGPDNAGRAEIQRRK